MPDLILNPPINGVSKVLLRDAYPLGRGGEAIIYPAEVSGKVYAAKIFHDSKNIDSKKIFAMINHPPGKMSQQVAGIDYPMYSWPLGMLYDSNNNAVGFLMPLIDLKQSFTLDYYYDQGLIGKLNSVNEYALSYRIEIAMHLSEMVADLHEHQHYFIDIKPQNVRVFKTTHAVTLIDCDGFSIYDADTTSRYPATMYSSDYIAPEVLKSNLAATKLGEEQDLYGLATIIFQLFNWGIHPFQGIIQPGLGEFDTNDDKAKALLYPHGIIAHPQIKPRPQSVHACFDDVTRQMFDEAFIGPAASRPKARQWANHLRNLYESKQLAKCTVFPNDIKHMRWAGKECPQCFIESVSQSSLQPKVAPISMPKPVSVSSYAKTTSTNNANTSNSSLVTKPKKSYAWTWIFVPIIFGIIRVIMHNSSSVATSGLDSAPAAAPPAYDTAPSYHTAIFWDSSGDYGMTSSIISQSYAEQQAYQACGHPTCTKLPVADTRCISIAINRDNRTLVIFVPGNDMESTQSRALDLCNKDYGNCYIPPPSSATVCAD